MSNPSQLFLLADHIKLSLLERQRAIALDLEPNSQDGEISRSLESLREGIEKVEADAGRANEAESRDQISQLHLQLRDLSAQFHGHDASPAVDSQAEPAVTRPENPTPDLKQPVPQHPPSKSVRFMDNAAADMDDDPNRANLFQPYRDSPSPDTALDQSGMNNEEIHAHHSSVMHDQDEQLDRLGESIGRQHQLSIQMGDELEGHVQLLDGMDGDVGRHQTRLDRAKRRLDRIRRSAGDNLSMMTIIGLIIVLVILIVILK